jgi:DNA polymerase-3 subunit delta
MAGKTDSTNSPRTNKAQQQNEHVFVIAGDNPSLVNAKYVELIEQLIPHEERDMGLLSLDADKAIIGEVMDELCTLPFLTKKRVVALRNADKFISGHGEEDEQDKQDKHGGLTNREILEKYFDKPCPTGVLVMTVSKWASNTTLAKMLPKIGTLIKVESPKGKEVRQLLIAYAQDKHSKRIEYGAVDLLVELAGEDISRLYTEVDKLATYAMNEKFITIAHVEAIVGRNRLFDAFKVIDACLQQNAAEAVERLRKMFADDKSAEYTTLGAFAYHFRRMFNVKKMIQEGMNEYQVSQKIWMGYNKDAQFALLRRLTIKQIGDQMLQLAETDYAIKRGQVQPRNAMEQLVLRMSAL